MMLSVSSSWMLCRFSIFSIVRVSNVVVFLLEFGSGWYN